MKEKIGKDIETLSGILTKIRVAIEAIDDIYFISDTDRKEVRLNLEGVYEALNILRRHDKTIRGELTEI